jgi:predicted RNA-binding Zn-ribbon protein involved in translation (DUF1610 family)
VSETRTPQPTDEAPPTIWGKPATWDEDDPLLDTFSHWLCPHCGAHLVKSDMPLPMHGNANKYICLNACHFTAPMHAELDRGIQAAARSVGANSILYGKGRGE